MGYVVRMPQLGMSMEEGTVVEWVVGEGGEVAADGTVAVVESEKTTAEVEAREDGVLQRVLVPEGGTVEPGDPIGVVAGPDEPLEEYTDGLGIPESGDAGAAGGDRPAADGDVRASPGARRLADEEGIDLAAVDGTGPDGVVTEDDVQARLTGTGEDAEGGGGATRTVAEATPLSGMQRTISDRLGESYRNAVHVTLNRSFDAGTLSAAVAAGREAGADVSVTDLLVKAAGVALRDHPGFNAVFEDGEHRLIEEVNVGIAVDVDRGLVTPVVPGVDERSAESVGRRRRAVTERARNDEFTPDDLAGGTFTVSNLGLLGVDAFDPIIDPPQVAILGVGRTREDGTMTLSLSFDHRVVNGADAARFLDSVVGYATDADALAGFFDADVAVGSGRATETREVSVTSEGGLSGAYRADGLDGAVAFDEPTEAGGSGGAPTPVEHLLGALGSCLTLSLRAMADRQDVAVGEVTCEVDGSPEQGPLEDATVTLVLESDADDDAVEGVVTRAERACYVERALAEDLEVTVEWERA